MLYMFDSFVTQLANVSVSMVSPFLFQKELIKFRS